MPCDAAAHIPPNSPNRKTWGYPRQISGESETMGSRLSPRAKKSRYEVCGHFSLRQSVDRVCGAIKQAGLVAAIEQAADGIALTDTCGRIQYVNPAFSEMTGYTRDEVMGHNPRLLKSGQQSE